MSQIPIFKILVVTHLFYYNMFNKYINKSLHINFYFVLLLLSNILQFAEGKYANCLIEKTTN